MIIYLFEQRANLITSKNKNCAKKKQLKICTKNPRHWKKTGIPVIMAPRDGLVIKFALLFEQIIKIAFDICSPIRTGCFEYVD